ncbi:MAG TPA: NUDIX-like domain-containing protein, partial [Geobacteraceae bacterium]
MRYPEAVNLPFNRDLLGTGFVLLPGVADEAEPGFWVILQGGSIVVQGIESGGALPEGALPAGIEVRQGPFTIGRWQDRPLRVVTIGRESPPPDPYVAEPFNSVEERLDDRILTL